MNTLYQQQTQADLVDLESVSAIADTWSLESQVKALENFKVDFRPFFQHPQIPEPTPQARSLSPAQHLGDRWSNTDNQVFQPLHNASFIGTSQYGRGSNQTKGNIPSVRIPDSQNNNAWASDHTTGWIPNSTTPSQAAASHGLLPPRLIKPLPSRAAAQSVASISEAPLFLDPSAGPMSLPKSTTEAINSMSDEEIEEALSWFPGPDGATSSMAQRVFPASSSSSAVAQAVCNTYESHSEPALPRRSPFPCDAFNLPTPSTAQSRSGQHIAHEALGSLPQSSSAISSTSKRKRESSKNAKKDIATLLGLAGLPRLSPFPCDASNLPTSSSAQSRSGQHIAHEALGSLPQSSSAISSTSKRKRESSSNQRTSKKGKKDIASLLGLAGTAHSTASAVQYPQQSKQQVSASRDIPKSNDTLLFHPGVNTGPKTQSKESDNLGFDWAWEQERHGCLVEGCPHIKPFNRRVDYHRHVCNVKWHADIRAIPGWEKRYRIPDDYPGKQQVCPYVSCGHKDVGMRSDFLNKHMKKAHGIGMQEWRRRIAILTWRWKRDGTWTADDEKMKEWVYEDEIEEFEDLPGDSDWCFSL